LKREKEGIKYSRKRPEGSFRKEVRADWKKKVASANISLLPTSSNIQREISGEKQ